jgi:two-component system response regulator AtoC
MLQESELTPVGATRPIKVDLRVIAATNRDLEAMVRQGEFREDLFYRLNVLRIDMPELAERVGDVPALADHLLVEIAMASQIPAPGFTREALEALSRRRWPGNVRELRNALERALLAARGRLIDAKDLPSGGAPAGVEDAPGSEEPLTLADAEKAHIEKVLALCRWNRSAAAKLMAIDRRTLFSKIQRHGLIGPLRGTGEGAVEDDDEPEPA